MLPLSVFRGMKDMESEISSIEKRFAYGFLQKLLKWMEIAQEFIAHLGTVGQKCKRNVLMSHVKNLWGTKNKLNLDLLSQC